MCKNFPECFTQHHSESDILHWGDDSLLGIILFAYRWGYGTTLIVMKGNYLGSIVLPNHGSLRTAASPLQYMRYLAEMARKWLWASLAPLLKPNGLLGATNGRFFDRRGCFLQRFKD